jgi:hypothetical protein
MTRHRDNETIEEFPQLSQMQSMTVQTTKKVTDWSTDTIYALLAAKEIRGFLMGSRRYIDAASVRDYIARRSAEPLTIRRSPSRRVGRVFGPAASPSAKP